MTTITVGTGRRVRSLAWRHAQGYPGRPEKASDEASPQQTPENLPAGRDDAGTSAARGDAGMSVSAKVLSHVLESSARLQAPAFAPRGRLRRANPEASPAEIVGKLEKHYLAAVMASGGRRLGRRPGIGTLTALSAVAGETVLFLEATAAFALAVADVHGIPLEDRERRRNLVLRVLVGEQGKGRSAICSDRDAPAAPGWPRRNCCRCRWCRSSTPS